MLPCILVSGQEGEEEVELAQELARFSPARDTVLTIGVFDGVHRGHQHLLAALLQRARERDLLAGVVTFHQHPKAILRPEQKLPFLTPPEERTRLLEEQVVPLIVTLPFTPELAQIRARDFVGLLLKYLHMRGLVIGPDFALGRNREGDINLLGALGQEMGFTVEAVPPLSWKGKVVSSTAIRKALERGDMATVREYLGRPFSLKGQVVAGVARGRELGFPTANLALKPQQALPADGVYAVRAYLNQKTHPAVTNVGVRPTFGGGERGVEVYLLDFQGSLYGETLCIELLHRLRPERKFSGPQELAAQIARDVAQARALLQEPRE